MPPDTKSHYKVNVHSKNYANADLVINRKDFPDLHIGDLVEIYHPEDEFSRLLLQVTIFKEDLPGKDTVSVEAGAAGTFQLRPYNDVIVRKVNSNSVSLDSLEVIFKDQYLGRSEMWRLKNNLVNTCVYLNKKIEFCSGTARVQVCEMWCRGERVACGVISEETKIVFRSSTSMVYLFVQMSSEMWEFDIYGDLYFEKAVNGFLADLFHKWKKHGSNHEVTIVLFSRVFYKANHINEFPDHMRECLQRDYKNQFYEDFYRVAIQNEKYDDWNCKLFDFQVLFTEYRKTVLEHHKKQGCKIPQAYLSTAAHGNFLEVLNISLNVFEKHYLERSLDRTGQLSIVISPGVGVFEVDRELTNVTKQRIIDNGVGCDLVCIGEQPLHAVPLLKFHNKDTTIMRDDYSMPHWINLSFYSTEKKLAYSKFIPRIRLPARRSKSTTSTNYLLPIISKSKLPTAVVEETSLLGCSLSPSDVNYYEYDEQVFTLPSSHIVCVQKLFSKTRKLSFNQDWKPMKWKLSDPDIYRSHLSAHNCSSTRSKSVAISKAEHATSDLSQTCFNVVDCKERSHLETTGDETNTVISIVGSLGSKNASCFNISHKSQLQNSNARNPSGSTFGPGRALINPFDPSHVTVKVTSNRRRWTHVFPKGPNGIIIQQHHYQPELLQDNDFNENSERASEHELHSSLEDDLVAGLFPTSDSKLRSKPSTFVGSPTSGGVFLSRKAQTLLWGATGEQKWTPTLTTGVDWKSLVIPACLPITTDFFPDEVSLNNDYLFSDYNLLPDDVNADYARKRAIYRAPLGTSQVLWELISQRLAQGFQLIVDADVINNHSKISSTVTPKGLFTDKVEYKLSIGRIFHKLSLCKSEIRITRYRPKHPYPPFIIQYRYRFQAPDHVTYSVSWASFNAEKLENFNWNYLDHYICTRGDTDFCLIESCKFWRFRLYALPLIQPGTKKILDGSTCCDVYTRNSYDEKLSLVDGFLKFTESPVNKVKRMPILKPVSKTGGNANNTSLFRDRLGSINRSGRPRSVSKLLDKPKISPIADIIPPLAMSLDSDNCDVFENRPETVKTKNNLSNAELMEMMCYSHDSLNFLSRSPSLPSNTFISYDAVQWLKNHIDGIFDEQAAIHQMEELRKENFICHASGDNSHPFIYGFYLYYIPRKEDRQCKDFTEPIYDLVTFKNEWAEIEIVPVVKTDPCPVFLQRRLPVIDETAELHKKSIPAYKEAHLEADTNGKSDRIEWGHFRYQSRYSVEQAYELVIEWMAASGPIISDLINSLVRKAQSYNLQLIPVPADPHALPYVMKSDPLRGPVFVPLDVSCLSDNGNDLFEEYEPETRLQRLLLLQEEIAIRFGFMSYKDDSDSRHNQYVHLTGNVFLLIISPLNGYWMDQEYFTQLRNKCRLETNLDAMAENEESKITPHQEYIRRHITEYHEDKYKTDKRVGYVWSWNHMIGRRWRGTNAAINDEAFQDKLLGDFRKFCSNDSNRLKSFWSKCCSRKPCIFKFNE